jgi:hypothetical protein
MDKRVENGVSTGVNAVRGDIATLAGEIKRLDDKFDSFR